MKTQKTNMVMGTALSIHPRNWHMVDKTYKPSEKKNTAGKAKPAKVAAHQAHVEANPNDAKSASHLKRRMGG